MSERGTASCRPNGAVNSDDNVIPAAALVDCAYLCAAPGAHHATTNDYSGWTSAHVSARSWQRESASRSLPRSPQGSWWIEELRGGVARSWGWRKSHVRGERMEAQTALIEEASPPSDTTQQDAGDLGSAPTTSAHEDTSSAHDAGRKSPRAGDSLRRSGVGSGLVASVMGIDTERTNPLSPAEAAALGDRLPEPPHTRYIVIGTPRLREPQAAWHSVLDPTTIAVARSAGDGSASTRGRVQEAR